MPFLLAEILNFQGLAHLIGVGSFSDVFIASLPVALLDNGVCHFHDQLLADIAPKGVP